MRHFNGAAKKVTGGGGEEAVVSRSAGVKVGQGLKGRNHTNLHPVGRETPEIVDSVCALILR